MAHINSSDLRIRLKAWVLSRQGKGEVARGASLIHGRSYIAESDLSSMQAELAINIGRLDRAEAQRIHSHVALRYDVRCRIDERIEVHALQRGCQVVGLKNNRSGLVGWINEIRSKQLAPGNFYSGNY